MVDKKMYQKVESNMMLLRGDKQELMFELKKIQKIVSDLKDSLDLLVRIHEKLDENR